MKEEKTYTYLMYDGVYYKIGKSRNPKQRLSVLKTANPNIVLIMYTDIISEKLLHDTLIDYNIAGEWFEFNSEQVKLVEEVMTPYVFYNDELVIKNEDTLDLKRIEFEKLKNKRKEEENLKFETVNYFKSEVDKLYNITMNHCDYEGIYNLIKKYSIEVVLKHSEYYLKQSAAANGNEYDWFGKLSAKLYGITYKTEAQNKVSYIIGICRNKFHYVNKQKMAIALNKLSLDDLKTIEIRVKNNEFYNYSEFMEQIQIDDSVK